MRFRITAIAAICLGLLGVVGANYFRLMLGEAERLLMRPYANSRLQVLVESLLAQGIIGVAGDEVTVDEDRFLREVPEARARRQVRQILPFIRPSDGASPGLDPRAVQIRHQPAPAGIPRGPILDRDGEILAGSIRDSGAQQSWRRDYPLGPAAFHVVGASHPAFGDRGIEAAYRGDLARGRAVTLTLSAPLQRAAYDALADYSGAAVMIAVPSAEILAAASRPSFDPGKRGTEAWLRAERDPAGPFRQRAFDGRYPPGSTFKVVVTAAWLEASEYEPGLTINCTRATEVHGVRDLHWLGPVTLESALARSCNVFFAEVGVRVGPRLLGYAERFGFNQPQSILLGNNRQLRAVPSLAFAWWDPDKQGLRRYGADDFRHNRRVVAQSAIGQNLVTATPLQMALVAATVAADGRRAEPTLIQAVGSWEQRRSAHRADSVAVMRPDTARAITRMMQQVMTAGTGRALPRLWRNDGAQVSVAGKTGTADVGSANRGSSRPHAWFIGFAPAERPKVAVAVLIEHGGAGAEVAGPIGVTLLGRALGARVGGHGIKAVRAAWTSSPDSTR
jgi:peptidoglycan glycosyltransferase